MPSSLKAANRYADRYVRRGQSANKRLILEKHGRVDKHLSDARQPFSKAMFKKKIDRVFSEFIVIMMSVYCSCCV